jgi:hypothetical protein
MCIEMLALFSTGSASFVVMNTALRQNWCLLRLGLRSSMEEQFRALCKQEEWTFSCLLPVTSPHLAAQKLSWKVLVDVKSQIRSWVLCSSSPKNITPATQFLVEIPHVLNICPASIWMIVWRAGRDLTVDVGSYLLSPTWFVLNCTVAISLRSDQNFSHPYTVSSDSTLPEWKIERQNFISKVSFCFYNSVACKCILV